EVYFVLEQNFTHGCTFEKDLQKKCVHFIVAVKLAYRMTHEKLGSLLVDFEIKNSLAFWLDNEKIDGTLMAPDGFEAWSPKTRDVIAQGWSYKWQMREMVEYSWQA
ncbi:hypothetical protein CFP56_040955, partial [Quercus suber]